MLPAISFQIKESYLSLPVAELFSASPRGVVIVTLSPGLSLEQFQCKQHTGAYFQHSQTTPK